MALIITDDELEAQCKRIIKRLDYGRLDMGGGYPSDYAFKVIDGTLHVIWATVDHDEAPELTIMPCTEFCTEYAVVVDEDEEE